MTSPGSVAFSTLSPSDTSGEIACDPSAASATSRVTRGLLGTRFLSELRDKDSNLDSRIQSPITARRANPAFKPKYRCVQQERPYNWVARGWINGNECGRDCSLFVPSGLW